jgi:hypothetical protein
LQLRKLNLILPWQQVGARRQDLAQLDEGWSQVLERHTDVLGLCIRLGAPRMAEQTTMERHEAVEPKDTHEIAESVAGKRVGDLAIATCMRWFVPKRWGNSLMACHAVSVRAIPEQSLN